MEDHKQSRTQPAADKEEKVLDLTKDMELADQAKHKIFDLSEGKDSPVERQPEELPPAPPAPTTETVTTESASPESDEPEIELPPDEADHLPASDDAAHTAEDDSAPQTPSALDQAPLEGTGTSLDKDSVPEKNDPITAPAPSPDNIMEMPEPPNHEVASETSITIENEVDAAFDAVQSEPPAAEKKEEANNQLFDKLSGITQMVDDAVRKIGDDDPPQDDPPPLIDEEKLASDAAELEAAISGVDDDEDDDDDIIELTEIVDPSEVMASKGLADADDDEIIDLVDIVDPAELELEARQEDDGMPANATVDQTGIEPNASDDLDQDAISEPVSDLAAPPSPDEEELALSDLDDFDSADDMAEDLDPEDDFEVAEIDNLFGDDDFTEEAVPEDIKPTPDPEDEHGEQVILLTDVLKTGTKEEHPPVEEIKPEGEEDSDEDLNAMENEKKANRFSLAAAPDAKEQQDLSNSDIEATVEHILQTKYAETMERLVADAVEKAVTREVENIRRNVSDSDE